MNDFSEELLSAYLDGELPQEERVRVEQWLAASANHRRMFDDLVAIRRELQALPRQALDTGFSDRVLAAIRERSRETTGSSEFYGSVRKSDALPAGSVEGIVADECRPVPKHVADAMGMPGWQWFAAGVAATLALVVLLVSIVPERVMKINIASATTARDQPAQQEVEYTRAPALESSTPLSAEPAPFDDQMKQAVEEQVAEAKKAGETGEARGGLQAGGQAGEPAASAGGSPARAMSLRDADAAGSAPPSAPARAFSAPIKPIAPEGESDEAAKNDAQLALKQSRSEPNAQGLERWSKAVDEASAEGRVIEVQISAVDAEAGETLQRLAEARPHLSYFYEGLEMQRAGRPVTLREAAGAEAEVKAKDTAQPEQRVQLEQLDPADAYLAPLANLQITSVEVAGSPEEVKKLLAAFESQNGGRAVTRLGAVRAQMRLDQKSDMARSGDESRTRGVADKPTSPAPDGGLADEEASPSKAALGTSGVKREAGDSARRPAAATPAPSAAPAEQREAEKADANEKKSQAGRNASRSARPVNESEASDRASQLGDATKKLPDQPQARFGYGGYGRGEMKSSESMVRVRFLFVPPTSETQPAARTDK